MGNFFMNPAAVNMASPVASHSCTFLFLMSKVNRRDGETQKRKMISLRLSASAVYVLHAPVHMRSILWRTLRVYFLAAGEISYSVVHLSGYQQILIFTEQIHS